MDTVLEAALRDARRLARAGFDALLVENHGDAPFPKDSSEPHVHAAMALVVKALQDETVLPVGVNCLRNDALGAMGVAAVTGARFIRVNVLVGTSATDQGIIEGRARELLAYRSRLAAPVAILADLDVKFATPLQRQEIPEALQSLIQRGGADGIIVTGPATGTAPDPEEVAAVSLALPQGTPLVVGSGVSSENLSHFDERVSGFIVGSSLKEGGDVSAPVAPGRAEAFMASLRELRSRMDRETPGR